MGERTVFERTAGFLERDCSVAAQSQRPVRRRRNGLSVHRYSVESSRPHGHIIPSNCGEQFPKSEPIKIFLNSRIKVYEED